MKEREAVKGLYNNPNWHRQVNKMSDAKVIAIYLSKKRQGKL